MLLIHTSRSSWYLTVFLLPSSFDVQLGLVEAGKGSKMSMIDSESNSSSSSSLVYDFRRTKDPFRVNWEWLPQSPKICATEVAGGGR